MLTLNPSLTPSPQDSSLLTDLYQLTMSACYAGEGIAEKRASFELFVRSLPDNFGYLIAMGLTQGLNYLENLRFSSEQIDYLKNTGIFDHVSPQFWSLLENQGFAGDVWAVPEGTPIFANEPFLRVEAPLWQAQIVETYLLNTINYQTLIATRAARMRDMAGENPILLEFGTRRAFSPQGAMWAARAALAAGFDATSNVLAAKELNQQPRGTMAHALVMAFTALSGSEDEAFTAFNRYFPSATLLIDTYDTLAAAERLAKKIEAGEAEVKGVRLDSGDLGDLSKKVRSLLPHVKIVASGDIDEWELQRLRKENASIDGYGVGTRLVTGKPVNGVYKLVEIDNIPTMKESSHKMTYPGRKQIFRRYDNGIIKSDRLALANEAIESGETALLKLVMKEGKTIKENESLETIAQRVQTSVKSLPEETHNITKPTAVKVNVSQPLEQLRQSLIH
ncbi:nicotinate phosphoribosyltransferase [Crocosphaera chwakensis]|uniref:Nicotinate phosphoribosyltransferase n=1 Tax=Crocosphaera chwakensis CCY0110 TaxID=391612 RepID=A3IX60_9CHRO|nr:nicotinate phosphoribosyltransferase [Crocosphaera chwakensis]EAZ88947.1 nicotinate phosphoribosyltransferase [Crocosphaera chwakensis CCY0110]